MGEDQARRGAIPPKAVLNEQPDGNPVRRRAIAAAAGPARPADADLRRPGNRQHADGHAERQRRKPVARVHELHAVRTATKNGEHSLDYARSLIEASLDPLVTISPQGKITDVNEATVKVTGTPREELIDTDFADYFTQPDKAREGYQRVFSEGSVTDYPLTIRHQDGRLTDVLYNASVYRDSL